MQAPSASWRSTQGSNSPSWERTRKSPSPGSCRTFTKDILSSNCSLKGSSSVDRSIRTELTLVALLETEVRTSSRSEESWCWLGLAGLARSAAAMVAQIQEPPRKIGTMNPFQECGTDEQGQVGYARGRSPLTSSDCCSWINCLACCSWVNYLSLGRVDLNNSLVLSSG